MAIKQEPLKRSAAITPQTVSVGTGLTQLSEATQAVSDLITNKLTDVAVEDATVQGALDVEQKLAPENLAPGLTKATRAYNEAVTRTEARRQVASAQEQINDAFARHSDPSQFNANSPAALKAELNGIKTGTLKNVRPEIHAAVSSVIDERSSDAANKMHLAALKHDSDKIQTDYKNDVNKLSTERSDAALAGNTERMAELKKEIGLSVADYSTMHEGIKQNAPNDLQKLEENFLIDDVLLNYGHALEAGTTEQFMSDLADNKQKLPQHVMEKAWKEVAGINQQRQNLKHSLRGSEVAGLERGINNGTITTESQIVASPNITTEQKLDLGSKLDRKLAADFVNKQKTVIAKDNISNGNPTFNSATTVNGMLKDSNARMQAATGEVPTLAEMEQSILGLNAFPSSGMPGVAVGTNVPAFDGKVGAALTSGDPRQIAEAGLVYNNMVNVREGTANMINLTGEALTVATLFNTYKQGMNIDEAAQLASDKVMKASDADRQERAIRYKDTVANKDRQTGKSKLEGIYKDMFGAAPQQFNSDRSYNLFKEIYAAEYVGSSSEQAALDATKYAMRNFQTSKYMDEGFVSNQTPETATSIADKGNSFGNQVYYNVQNFMEKNNKLAKENPELKLPTYEWADPAQQLPTDPSESDRVLNNYSLPVTSGFRSKDFIERQRKRNPVYTKPRIKVNGVETDVVLMETPISRLGTSVNYTLGGYDKFNNLQALKDSSNTVNNVATFKPQTFKEWAPQMARDEETTVLTARAKRDVDKAHKKEIEDAILAGGQSPIRMWNYLKSESRQKEITDTTELLRESLNPTKSQVRKELSQADDIGIAVPPSLKNPKGDK